MFGNLGFGELMVILVIVLVLFGAKRVPEITASLGKGIREFKRNLEDVQTTITDARDVQPVRQILPPVESTSPPSTDDVRSEPKRLLLKDEEMNR